MEAVKRNGGARVGAGKAKDLPPDAVATKRTVSIDDETAAILTALGGGKLSRGIREAARIIKAQQ
ncbi:MULTISPECIES: hypothetical protein [Pseudomonas]|uniref:Uncharacterized protein n=1 Tax=Pseudomonas lutea TaxID=243924 RepID=A0A9X8MH73_9PSED|nr:MULTISPECIES: hypothetical protein [Pseudomonas]SER37679.1 hypothetical protein SAMN05216409_118106 [Pseudomonas lutea]